MRRHAAIFGQPFAGEADFQAELIRAAKRMGWRAYHTHDSRRSEEGFPDLVLASRTQRRVIYAELKRPGEDPTEAQAWWGETLTAAGEEYHLWRYADWDAALRALWKRPEGGVP